MEKMGINLIEDLETWEVKIDGIEKRELETNLMKIEENQREKVFLTAAKILSKCPNPSKTEGSTKGLALGKVQSGKTGSFIALTALAFDNRYRIVIILAGTKNNLLEQTKKRIHRQLNLDYRTDRKIASLSTLKNIEGVQEQEALAILQSGNNVLITVLKHHDHINHISTIFSLPELNHYPTLIIDDEGDQASLNNKRKKGQSSTYTEIIQLKNTFKLGGFVAFTATPQANLLIETFDDLSPNFCVLIEPGNGYTGGSTFHGKDQDKYMKTIPESEIPFEDNVPESLLIALGDYFVGASLRSLRGDNDEHSMLVHTSVSKSDHHNVGTKVKAVIEKWKSIINLPEHDPAKGKVLKYLQDSYNNITNNGGNYPGWLEVNSQIKSEMTHLKTWVVNSSPNAEVPTDKLNLKNNIFIGGNMMERGVTIEGLAITYITRRAKESQADTVEQRARWFGYKKNYLDVCRVYAPESVKKGFADLLGDEDDLWGALKQNEAENIDINLWPRVIQCSEPFKPTRSSVAPTKNVNFDNWVTQTKVEITPSLAKANVDITNNIFNTIYPELVNFGGTKHYVVRGFSLKLAFNSLVNQIVTSRMDDELATIKVIIPRILKANDNQLVDIVFMNEKEPREREYDQKIIQLMQGKNKKYVGDRYLYDDELAAVSQFQLQVHIVRPTNKAKQPFLNATIALALHISDEIKVSLGRLVKPSAV